YALNALYKQHISPRHFAHFLERLAETNQQQDGKNQAEKSLGGFLSSYPATAERIQAVKAFEQETPNLLLKFFLYRSHGTATRQSVAPVPYGSDDPEPHFQVYSGQ